MIRAMTASVADLIRIRRLFVQVEDIHHEFGPRAARPLRRGVAAVVLTNPYAGRYEPDIVPMMDALTPVGIDIATRLLAAMAVPAESIEGYGKGAIVGSARRARARRVVARAGRLRAARAARLEGRPRRHRRAMRAGRRLSSAATRSRSFRRRRRWAARARRSTCR